MMPEGSEVVLAAPLRIEFNRRIVRANQLFTRNDPAIIVRKDRLHWHVHTLRIVGRIVYGVGEDLNLPVHIRLEEGMVTFGEHETIPIQRAFPWESDAPGEECERCRQGADADGHEQSA